ncbi:MAG: hypothetical protein AAFV53_06510 [Myxococcota bacterium]
MAFRTSDDVLSAALFTLTAAVAFNAHRSQGRQSVAFTSSAVHGER